MTTHAIQTFELEHDFGSEPVLQDLSLQVPRGSVYALLGRNGSGKTTLIRILLGMLQPRRGYSAVFGLDPTQEPIPIRTRIGYVPQENDFDPEMTVAGALSFVRAFYPGRWQDGEVASLVVRFGLARHKKIKQLSGGQKGHLALTAALGCDPEILILDEPTAGLDAVVRREVQEAIIDFMSRGERTVLLSSHQLNEVERLADRVAIVDSGRLLCEASVEGLKDRVARIKARFERYPPIHRVPGVIRFKQLDEIVHLTAWVDGEEGRRQLEETLAELGATEVVFEESSLESIFVDLVGGREHD